MDMIQIMDNNMASNGSGLKIRYITLCLMDSSTTHDISDPVIECERECSDEFKQALDKLSPEQLTKVDFIAQETWNLKGATKDDAIDYLLGELDESDDEQLEEFSNILDQELLR
jgi:hypothetical protein